MTEGLRRVPELLAGPGDFFGEHPEVVAEGEHVLEDGRCFLKVFLFVLAGLLR